jgi:hypothetical protein
MKCMLTCLWMCAACVLQVLPGMLHSSHRLRLVSKRRRQMSYCYFQVMFESHPLDFSSVLKVIFAGAHLHYSQAHNSSVLSTQGIPSTSGRVVYVCGVRPGASTSTLW